MKKSTSNKLKDMVMGDMPMIKKTSKSKPTKKAKPSKSKKFC